MQKQSIKNVNIKIEYNTQNLALFNHTYPAFERLQNMGAEIIVTETNDPLAEKLFNRDRKAGTYNAQDKIHYTRFDNKQDEITSIAQKIRPLSFSQIEAGDRPGPDQIQFMGPGNRPQNRFVRLFSFHLGIG